MAILVNQVTKYELMLWEDEQKKNSSREIYYRDRHPMMSSVDITKKEWDYESND